MKYITRLLQYPHVVMMGSDLFVLIGYGGLQSDDELPTVVCTFLVKHSTYTHYMIVLFALFGFPRRGEGCASLGCSAKPRRRLRGQEASYRTVPPPRKIRLISWGSMSLVSDIKLIRTDTTLDLSQKAEKGMKLIAFDRRLYTLLLHA